MLKLSELKRLPFKTLQRMAESLARDIDAGLDKQAILERVFSAIKVCP